MSAFKVVLVGDGAVGKSTYMKRLMTGEFGRRYVATLGVEIYPFVLHTNRGPICFNVWDTAGQEKFGDLRNGYYVDADAYIVMFDTTSRITWNSVPMWHRDVIAKNSKWSREGHMEGAHLPGVLCRNKADIGKTCVKSSEVTAYSKVESIKSFHISVRSNYQIERPWVYLARQLLDDPDLEFVNSPAGAPPIAGPMIRALPLCSLEQRIVDESDQAV